ncbi:TPA: hypothetical protein DCE37_24200 [Candidatus Latescibacteria bacterium]|nr:hypothetical protein [Candidatus Latescibacterota bacterium]
MDDRGLNGTTGVRPIEHRGKMRSIKSMAVAGLMIGLAGCGGEQDAVEATPTREAIKATNVAVMVVRSDSLTEVGRYPASVEAWRDVQLSFLESGPVRRILVDLGDTVKKGQLLATLYTSLLDAAQIEAEAGAKFHRYNHERSKQLFEDGTISERDLFQSEYDLKRAESNLAMIRQRLENSTLLAPFDGMVAARMIEVGHLTGPSQQAIQVVQWDRVKMRAWVSESDISDFDLGRQVDVLLDALSGRVFQGVVGRIGPAADPKRRVFPVEVHIDNSDGEIRPGMLGKLVVRRKTHEDVVVIPREAVVEREMGPVTFVVSSDVASVRKLSLGASQGNRVIALAGLTPGDQVVVSGGRDLIDGERVTVRETRQ